MNTKTRMTSLAILLLVAVAVGASPSHADNLAVGGGALLPIADFSDIAAVSPYINGRYEIQDTNARGKTALRSYIIQAGFAFLQTNSDYEKALDLIGDTKDGTLFDVGLGARVYSKKNSLFVGAGGEYVRMDPPGELADALDGAGFYAAAGLAKNTETFRLEVEVRASFVFGDDNLQYFQFLANFGLPF